MSTTRIRQNSTSTSNLLLFDGKTILFFDNLFLGKTEKMQFLHSRSRVVLLCWRQDVAPNAVRIYKQGELIQYAYKMGDQKDLCA